MRIIKQKKYFITYGTKNFNIQKKRLISTARKVEIFDNLISLDFNDLDSEFKKRHSNILINERLGGFGIWKHHIIKNLLEQINEGDIIVYSDSGSSFNPKGIRQLNNYFEKLNTSNSGNLMFKLPDYVEKNWTIKEIFKHFNLEVESEIGNSSQLISGHMLFKKNKNMIDYFKEYEKFVNVNSELLTNNLDNIDQIDEFKENRHDQSIFSILSKIYEAEVIDDETWFENNPQDQFEYPFLAVRQKKYSVWQIVKFYIFYFYYKDKTVYFGEKKYWYLKPSIFTRIKYKLGK